MAIIELILEILLLILALLLVISVALQKSKSEGITGVTANSESENYFGKGKEIANEEKLARITKVCMIIFVVLSVLLAILCGMDSAAKEAAEPATETARMALTSLGL